MPRHINLINQFFCFLFFDKFDLVNHFFVFWFSSINKEMYQESLKGGCGSANK